MFKDKEVHNLEAIEGSQANETNITQFFSNSLADSRVVQTRILNSTHKSANAGS